MVVPDNLTGIDLVTLIRKYAKIKCGSARVLMDQLAWRARADRNYTCWPTMANLMDDCNCSDQTIRNAREALKEAGFVDWEWVPQKAKNGRWSSDTKYYLSVKKLLELKAEVEAATPLPHWEDKSRDKDPFGHRVPSSSDGADDLDFFESTEQEYPCATLQNLFEIIYMFWPDHPAFANAQEEANLRNDLEQCATLAGSIPRCGQAISLTVTNDDAVNQSVANAQNLGRYLLKCLPGWMSLHENLLSPIESEVSE